MLVRMGYVDDKVIILINSAFDKLDIDGNEALSVLPRLPSPPSYLVTGLVILTPVCMFQFQVLNMDDVVGYNGNEAQRMVDELRREYGLKEKDEERIPIGDACSALPSIFLTHGPRLQIHFSHNILMARFPRNAIQVSLLVRLLRVEQEERRG